MHCASLALWVNCGCNLCHLRQTPKNMFAFANLFFKLASPQGLCSRLGFALQNPRRLGTRYARLFLRMQKATVSGCRFAPPSASNPRVLIPLEHKKARKRSCLQAFINGGRGGTRTHDQRFRKPLLYPLSYTPIFFKDFFYTLFFSSIKKIF